MLIEKILEHERKSDFPESCKLTKQDFYRIGSFRSVINYRDRTSQFVDLMYDRVDRKLVHRITDRDALLFLYNCLPYVPVVFGLLYLAEKISQNL